MIGSKIRKFHNFLLIHKTNYVISKNQVTCDIPSDSTIRFLFIYKTKGSYFTNIANNNVCTTIFQLLCQEHCLVVFVSVNSQSNSVFFTSSSALFSFFANLLLFSMPCSPTRFYFSVFFCAKS